ncbi:MAG: hypothetical protein JXA96_17165 [Sedimentisphaerales bacterium]|nr:hypothetical protein [Sedimentisphaerales bacterium]
MCQFRSADVVYNSSNQSITVYILPNSDSHTAIKMKYNIRDDGFLAKHCPIEYVPTKALDDFDSYDFIFGAGKPDWWLDEHETQVKRELQANIKSLLSENKLEWDGDLRLDSLTSLPEGVTLTAGRYLFLDSLTSLPAGGTIKAQDIYYAGRWHGPIYRKGKNEYT